MTSITSNKNTTTQSIGGYVISWQLKQTPAGYVLIKQQHELGQDVLSSLQAIVGGLIEVVTYLDGAVLLMNEEALVEQQLAWVVSPDDWLHRVVPEHMQVQGNKVLVGTVVLAADDGLQFSGFTAEQAASYMSK
ncbi:DUF3846 domain-containing protein [Vibrio cholerae]|uniref:DUF3846 domain-containing protein n=1 Tax=Vibrio cholerae TaxID=666 RepID=UPI003530C4DA|nr:hypothetical protein [Vibrio cholerae]EJL6479659.1 hypothetical protein [Vibrio cholerae]